MSSEAVIVNEDEWTREEWDAFNAKRASYGCTFNPAGASPLSEKGYAVELPVTLSQSEDGNTWKPLNEEEASKIVATAHLLPRNDNA